MCKVKTSLLILTLCFHPPAIMNNQTEVIIADLSDSFNLTNATLEPDVKGEAICNVLTFFVPPKAFS